MALFEALFVGSVLVAMLGLLFVGWKTPEIVVRVCPLSSISACKILDETQHMPVSKNSRNISYHPMIRRRAIIHLQPCLLPRA